MGNKSSRSNVNRERVDGVYKQKEDHFSQFHSICNNSLRSFLSVDSQQSVYSVSRPWSRVSRRRWRESTLTLPYESSKTAWPVSQLESYFLPEFPISDSHNDNKFVSLQEVRRGAFGKVYKVKSLDTDDIFALKVLSKFKVIKENSIKQVKEEVEIQRACGHHPFIVNCPLNWQSRKHLYIVTEFIDGGELWHLIDNLGILPIELTQLYVAQIAFAIDFLHNAGVIYRDLKPENILLDAQANVKLIDFGLSKWLPYGRTTQTVCGTPKYMAPEILKMEAYSHAVDWWSLGVIACVMMTTKFHSLESNNLDDPSAPGTIKFTVSLPTNVFLDVTSQDLLLRLLEVQPNKRLRSVRTLKTIAFYKGYKIEEVNQKKINPKDVLVKNFGKDYDKPKDSVASFEGFDEIFISE